MTDRLIDVPVQPSAGPGEAPTVAVETTRLPVADLPAQRPALPAHALPGVELAVDCPGCGTPNRTDPSRREAEGFCKTCDFPLFWAFDRLPVGGGTGEGAGLRRLPGTVGRATLASLRCPACTEPNPPAAVDCVRCGALLRPEPVLLLPPPPLPEQVPNALPWWQGWWGVALVVTVLLAAFTGFVYLTY